MREYFLFDPINPNGGITIGVKCDQDCVFCRHCSGIYWDYSNLIYMMMCELERDEINGGNKDGEHTCKFFEEDEEAN